jgi:hypothetical protein
MGCFRYSRNHARSFVAEDQGRLKDKISVATMGEIV